jgi:membrane fusion protein (multidrug efflux system)
MDQSGPNDRLFRILLGLTAALVLAGVALSLVREEPEGLSAAGQQAAALAVRTLRASPTQHRDRVVVPSVIGPRRRVRLTSETSGRVLAVGAEELDFVAVDAVLVQVDPLNAEVAVRRAEAAVARAQSELGLARTSLERQQSLAERAVSSDSALDDATNRSRVAQAAIQEARATLEQARDDLAKKTLRAPYTGVLRSFDVEPGEYGRVGQELGELLDISTARIEIGVSDRQIVALSPSQPVEVEVEAYPNVRFDGVILRVGAAAAADTRKFPVEVEIDNPEHRLLPGMVANVRIDVSQPVARILVPRDAVRSEFGLYFVYVVSADEAGRTRALRRRVEVRELPFEPALVELVSGVEPGEEIVFRGAHALRDGDPVRATPVAASAALVARDGSGDW